MADASDSKSDAGDCVWVQVPSPACKKDFIPNGMESFFEAERAMNPGFILRSASVGAKRSSPGRAAPHLLHVKTFYTGWHRIFFKDLFYWIFGFQSYVFRI